jgi:hypothetical protein
MSGNSHNRRTDMSKAVKNRIIKVTKNLSKRPKASVQVRKRKTHRRRSVYRQYRDPRPISSPRVLSSSSSSDTHIPLPVFSDISHASTFSNDTQIIENCSICMDDISCQDVVNVSCGHLFHSKCIQSWEKTSRSQHCPLCRTLYVSVKSEHVENFKVDRKIVDNNNLSDSEKLQKRITQNINEIDRWINTIDLTT